MTKTLSCKIAPKRFFLPLMGIVGLLYLEEVRNFFYIPFIVAPACFILFWNFPQIVYFTNSKPLYYEDLFVDEKKLPNYDVSPAIKMKCQKILFWSLIVSNSIFAGGLSEYWLYRTHDTTTYMEIMGITGGIIKVFQFINNFIGRILMMIIRRKVNTESTELKCQNRKKFRRMILLKRIQTNKWENISTPNNDINVVLHEKHHIEISSPPVLMQRPRSATI